MRTLTESIDLMKYWKEFVIVDCRVSPRDRRLPPFIGERATAIDRILQKFITSPAFKRRLSLSLSLSASLFYFPSSDDPLSSHVNRALSRRKADTRGRNVASFYLFDRRVYRIFLPSSSFDPSCFSVEDASLNVDKSMCAWSATSEKTLIDRCSRIFWAIDRNVCSINCLCGRWSLCKRRWSR